MESKVCDICGAKATIDGKTKFGPWAYMCTECHKRDGVGFGIGKGQKLVDIK